MSKSKVALGLGVFALLGLVYYLYKNPQIIAVAKQSNASSSSDSSSIPENYFVPQFEESQGNLFDVQNSSSQSIFDTKGSITNPYLPNEVIPAVTGETIYFQNADPQGSLGSVTTEEIAPKTIISTPIAETSNTKNSGSSTSYVSSSSGSKVGNAVKTIVKNIPIVRVASGIKSIFKKK